jgi:ABC-2 type transport system ATP-binding protein
VLEISHVTKRYHNLLAVNDISLQLRQGEVIGLLGPNGAGKTTLFKLIAGLLFPDSGMVLTNSKEWPMIGYKPERLLFPGSMRVGQYLSMVANLANLPKSQMESTIRLSLEQVNLSYAAEKRIKDCSKGMRQRLGLAQSMIGNPPLLLLDEPSNGLDPEGQAEICRQIKSLHEQGKTIILASHQLHEVTQVCTHLVILNNGSIHYENSMKDALAERPHSTITCNRSVEPLRLLLENLHPDIDVGETSVVLNYEAILLRPRVIGILLASGYDIVRVEQRRVSLAEIYAEAVQ